MLPAGLRGFASRVGRLALRAFAWNKEGAESCAAATSDSDSLSSSATTTDARISATTAARTARPARTLLRALFAMLLAAATLLAMLILPPVNKAKGNSSGDRGYFTNPYSQVWWDGMGTGYAVGNGDANKYSENGNTYHPAWFAYHSIDLPNPTIDKANRKISWTVRFMTDSKEYQSIINHEKIKGNDNDKGKPIIMVYLPKGIDVNSVVIDRRRTGKELAKGEFNTKYGCWKYSKRWQDKWGGYGGSEDCAFKAKTETDIPISDFSNPTSNWHLTDETKISNGFRDSLSSAKLGECSDENNNGAGMCTVRSWKSKLSALIMSWERKGLYGYEWHVTATYNQDVAHPELLPFIAGYIPNKVRLGADDIGGSTENARWAFMGPLDYDGDGIPDKIEHDMGTNPVEKTPLLYPKYNAQMLPDYIKKLKKQSGSSAYGGISNVPVTVFGTNAELKPYVETGKWEGPTGQEGHFQKKEGETTTNIPISDLPGEDGIRPLPDLSSMKYEIKSVPDGVSRSDYSGCNVSSTPGCVSVDRGTGVLKYNPRKVDIGHELVFTLKVHHPNSNIYPYWCAHGGDDGHWDESQQVKIKVVSQASIYNPQYSETVVHNIKQGNGYYTVGTADSAVPTSVANPHAKNPSAIYTGSLPAGTTFSIPDDAKHEKDRYKIGKEYVGDHKLQWSSMGNSKTGSVHFTPTKMDAGTSAHTPVVVTYPDGSTSEDEDAGNAYYNNNKIDKAKSVVYAPVKVDDLTVTSDPQDLHLDLKDGTQINNGQFGGWSFGDANNPKELSKTTKIGGPKENKNNGIVLDSWSTNAKGPITFRAVCHKKNDTKYKLLKPAEGNNKASGDINGLQFEEFRQWKRGNDKNCKDKNTCDLNKYLHNSEYNKDTMERSRALIGGKPKEGGEYECKVFAFHQAHDGKGTQHNGALNNFDNLASTGPSAVYNIDSISQFASVKGKEWVSGNFYFKIKLKDSQKYNPTYKTIPTIQAGTFANKETNSSGQPRSHTKIMVDGKKVNANGVPDEDLGGVEDGKALPPGTWFEIKKLVKKVDKTQPDKFPSENELWSNFKGGEDNVKRDNSGKPVMEKGKVVPLNETGREYGSVTFRPDKWKDAGQYWAEVVVHYPDGSASSDDDSINYKHPVYAKVNVTRDDAHNQFGLTLYKNYPNAQMGNGYDLKVGESLPNDATFDSWMTKSVGKLHQHVICSKKGKDGKYSDYTYNTLPGHVDSKAKNAKDIEKDGLRFKKQTIWGHATFNQQKSCIKDRNNCKPDDLLYDDWVPGGNSNNTSERTRGFFGGKAQKTGDYQCKVYVIRGDAESKKFAEAVKGNIKKSASKNPVDGVLNAKGNPYGTEGVGYKTDSFSVHIHNDNHFYNPKYVDVSVTAGQKVENAVPQSVKSANGADKYQDAVKAGALPDGTWFEFKDATHGFEVNANGTAGNKVSLDWSYWAGNAADKAGDQSNKPDNPKDPNNHKGKHSANGDGARYGKVTFHPDQSVAPKAYFKEIVIHYPDGSTSDNPDSGNNGKPVYAKVTVRGLSGADKDLKMTLLRSKDADPVHDTLDSSHSLTVMSGMSLTNNPYVRAWSLKDRSDISLRMMCTKQGEQKWSRGLEDTLNMHLNQNYGENVKPWTFANAAQRKSCSENSNNCMANLLYGFTKGQQNSIESAVSRSEDDIVGVPQKAGRYTCAVFALKPNALAAFNKTVTESLIDNNKYSSRDMKTVQLSDVTVGKDWNRIAVDVNVMDPPKFALPKTGGEDCVNWNMLMSVVCVLGTGAMAAGFFLDQTKWGRAMLEALLRKAMLRKAMRGGVRGAEGVAADCTARTTAASTAPASLAAAANRAVGAAACDHAEPAPAIKSFIRKTAERCGGVMLRIEWWITERWRC